MKKILAIILAALMLSSVVFTLASCGEPAEKGYNTEYPIEEIVSAVTDKLDYDGLVSQILYKENDPDELIKWQYGLYTLESTDIVKDYAISLPTDYAQTLAVLVLDEEVTEDQVIEIKEAVAAEYLQVRSSALQMYMPEEYEKMSWAIDNQDLIWKQYNNVLVLCIYDNAEGSNTAWQALEELFTK